MWACVRMRAAALSQRQPMFTEARSWACYVLSLFLPWALPTRGRARILCQPLPGLPHPRVASTPPWLAVPLSNNCRLGLSTEMGTEGQGAGHCFSSTQIPPASGHSPILAGVLLLEPGCWVPYQLCDLRHVTSRHHSGPQCLICKMGFYSVCILGLLGRLHELTCVCARPTVNGGAMLAFY